MPTIEPNSDVSNKLTIPVFFLLAPTKNQEDSALQEMIVDALIKKLTEREGRAAKFAFLHIGHQTKAQTEELEDAFSIAERPRLLDLEGTLSELDHALSRKTMLGSFHGSLCFPVVLYVGDCRQDFGQLAQSYKSNKWFACGLRLATFFSNESRAHFEGFCDLSECCYLCSCPDDCEKVAQLFADIIMRSPEVPTGDILIDDSEENDGMRSIVSTGIIVSHEPALEDPKGSLVRVDPIEPCDSDKNFVDDGWDDEELWDLEEPKTPVSPMMEVSSDDCGKAEDNGRKVHTNPGFYPITGLWVDSPTGDLVRSDPIEPNDTKKDGKDDGWGDEEPW